jgi:hypothetical protein
VSAAVNAALAAMNLGKVNPFPGFRRTSVAHGQAN